MHRRLTLAAALAVTSAFGAHAAGSESDTPPKTTKTVTECEEGQVYDEKAKACIEATDQSLNDDQRYDAVRELAYAGAYDRARLIIASADAPQSSRFLTYQGFIARKQGDQGSAMAFYTRALESDPDNLLARSYMGQGLFSDGDVAGAKMQLAEINRRGGRNSWAYAALKMAIGGQPSNY